MARWRTTRPALAARAINQFNRGVVPDQQVVRDLTDGRALWLVVAAISEQQLVLAGGEVVRSGLIGVPAFEAP